MGNLLRLPSKRYWYRIGEIARWLDVGTHVIRYWEAQFANELGKLERSPRGQRVYSRRNAVIFGAIKQMLYVEGYTTQGARRKLRELAREPA